MATNSFQMSICEYLMHNHRGEAAAIHSSDLEKHFGVAGSTLRAAIHQLRTNSYPICSSDAGYYYAANQDEIARTSRKLRKTMTAMSDARDGLMNASAQNEMSVHITILVRL